MTLQTALVIDDEPDIRELLELTLGRIIRALPVGDDEVIQGGVDEP